LPMCFFHKLLFDLSCVRPAHRRSLGAGHGSTRRTATIILSVAALVFAAISFGMIVYAPLWDTMKKKSVSTYTLRIKHEISSSTIQRLKKNMPVSTNTLNDLCRILKCTLIEVAEYVED